MAIANAEEFSEPPTHARFDTEAELAAIPEEATISGMFLIPLVVEAERRGYRLPSARDRYVPYRFYPLREHGRLLLETCELGFAGQSVRQTLRRLGRGAPKALHDSTLGKVMLGSVDSTTEQVRAMAKAYPLNVKPCRVDIVTEERERILIHADIPYFLDSHHVGAFEGVFKLAGVQGEVRMRRRERNVADLLLQWSNTDG